MSECLAHSSLLADSNGQVYSLAYKLAVTWRWLTFTQRTRVNCHMALLRKYCSWYCYYYYTTYQKHFYIPPPK